MKIKQVRFFVIVQCVKEKIFGQSCNRTVIINLGRLAFLASTEVPEPGLVTRVHGTASVLPNGQ